MWNNGLMAETESTAPPSEGASRPVQISLPPDEAPGFANYVQSSTVAISDESGLWTLMFIHVYPNANPTSPGGVELKGNVVARVSLNRETVEKLIQVLDTQLKQHPSRRARARRGKAPTNDSS
jgi:hypothetical protein